MFLRQRVTLEALGEHTSLSGDVGVIVLSAGGPSADTLRGCPLGLRPFELKIDTPLTSALGNFYNNVGFVSDLGARTGQTDGRKDGRRRARPVMWFTKTAA